MKILTGIVCNLWLAGLSLAEPQPSRSYCLRTEDAHRIATNYGSLISGFSDTVAKNVLSPEFTMYSTSTQDVIERCNTEKPFTTARLTPLFSGRNEFIRDQGAQAPLPYEQLNLWHSCDTITVRYHFRMSTFGDASTEQNIVGMTTMRVSPAPENHPSSHWINTLYNEYNLRAYKALLGPCNLTEVTIPASGPG